MNEQDVKKGAERAAASLEKYNTIKAIVKRAKKGYLPLDTVSFFMDIDFIHSQTPLDLERWLAADDENFFHDVFEILRNFNRRTRKMENFFVPRFTIHN